MKKQAQKIRSLDDFIRSNYFAMWDEDNRSTGSCGIILSDPDRFDRIIEAAEDGCDGSTHGEIIQDWRDALRSSDLNACTQKLIERDIDACEKWHIDNGSIDQSGM